MTEILTESFCERCGTRYTFESAAPRRSRLGRVRIASRGLRNYVMTDESSLSQAMAEARGEVERGTTAHQLDAFHKTFNFCLACRQYTCGNCWNVVEGQCLSCSPLDVADAQTATLVVGTELIGNELIGLELIGLEAGPPSEPETWPDADLGPDRLARAMGTWPTDDDEAAIEPPAADDAGNVTPTTSVAASDTVVDAPEPATQLRGLAPGQSIEDALAAFEAQATEAQATEAQATEAEPALEPELEPELAGVGRAIAEPVAAAPEPVLAEAEPVAAEPEPILAEAEPVAAEAEPEPVAAEPEPVAGAPDDFVSQPTWSIAPPPPPGVADVPPTVPVASPTPGPEPSPWLTIAPDDGEQPQWPVAPPWGAGGRGAPSVLARRALAPTDDATSLWAASAREVLGGGPRQPLDPPVTPAAAQPCIHCGLSLSANARFCRRCGARQA